MAEALDQEGTNPNLNDWIADPDAQEMRSAVIPPDSEEKPLVASLNDLDEINRFFLSKSEKIRDLNSEEKAAFTDMTKHWQKLMEKRTVKTGARPKHNKGLFNKSDTSDDYDTCEESTESSVPSESSSGKSTTDRRTKRNLKRPRTRKNRPGDNIENLTRAMEKLDTRKTPSPGKFGMESEIELKVFLDRFEIYCNNNFKGDKQFWIYELEQHLLGKFLTAFRVMKTCDDDYDDIKKKLLGYYKGIKSERKAKHRKIFRDIKFNRGEAVYFFSARLEKQYRLAYPSHNIKESKTLQEKFAVSLPKSIRALWKTTAMAHRCQESSHHGKPYKNGRSTTMRKLPNKAMIV